jgi:mannose-6-phosphate isomerase-like protein (cupin superfamily)
MQKVNLAEKLAQFSDQWRPKVVGELNGQQVKLVKFQGPFVWHHHDDEDELFLVVKGRFRMEFRDRHVWLGEGEFLIVPRGVEHRPVAEEEAHVLLFEPLVATRPGRLPSPHPTEAPGGHQRASVGQEGGWGVSTAENASNLILDQLGSI